MKYNKFNKSAIKSLITYTSKILMLLMIVYGCNSAKSKEQTITISGAFALYPLVVQWAEEYQKENPEIRFNISGGGAGKGMADALAGAVDLGMFSREITQAEKNKGVWWVGLTIDAVIPTISSENHCVDSLKKHGMTQHEFSELFFSGKTFKWNDFITTNKDINVVVYTRSDACGAAGTWAKYLGGNQEDIKGIGIFGDPGLAEAVSKDPLGIGYNNTIFVYDIKTGQKRPGIDIIPIDINGNGYIDKEEDFYDTFDQILNAIALNKYPSPPSRELYFVANGKPQKNATIHFIKWTLTKGQQFIKEAGYVPLDSSKIKSYLNQME